MGKHRVVITGLGTVNPLGIDVKTFWENSLKGCSGVKDITHLFSIPDHISQIAGVVDLQHIGSSRNQFFVNLAVDQALQQSLLFENEDNKSTCSVCIATAVGEISVMEKSFEENKNENGFIDFIPKNQKYLGDGFCFNNIAQKIAINHSIPRGGVTISTGCTGGNDAIGYAFQMIRSGKVKSAITGSVDAPITPLVVAAFGRIGATSLRNKNPKEASRPFDVDRDGFVLAEGCGILILEDYEFAVKRGAKILGEIVGYGSVNNFYHMIDIPEKGEAIARSCLLALEDGKISPDQIDFVNAHGSSTKQNDIAESNAFNSIFGSRIKDIPVTSIKSQLGHPLSAATSIEMVSAVLTLRDQIIPPTLNLKKQDSNCQIQVVANTAQERKVKTIIKTSSGFSGIHSCVILKGV